MRGTWLILLAAVLWGTTGTAQELGPDAASPLAVGSLRLLVGAGALLAIAALRLRGVDWGWLLRRPTLVAAAGMAAYQPFFFSGVDRTGVAIGTLLAIGSAPVFVGVIESILSGSWPRRTWVTATIPAIAGLAVLAVSAGDVSIEGMGVLFALCAGLSYAVYAVNATRLARLGPVRHSAAAIFGLAALMLVPVALTQDLSFVASGDGFAMTLWLGVAATTAAYLLFTSGLQTTDSTTAATLTLGEPVTATLLGVVVLSERPRGGAWVGIALISLGLVLAARGSRVEAAAKHG
jgi:DME family drug/metabolite transporter